MAKLTVGDFSRVTHLSVKMLRHYHEVGLLEPASIDPATSYRYYAKEQIPQAQVIKRLRELDMPIAGVKAVLEAPDASARGALIAKHLERLETELARTRAAVDSLKAILSHASRRPLDVEHRTIAATRAVAIRATVPRDEMATWWRGAIAELHATARAERAHVTGALGGLFTSEVFEEDRGDATMFLPVSADVRPVGRVVMVTIPAAEVAIVTHAGSYDHVDVAYGDLGAHVADHEIGVEGPIREYYLRDPSEHPDPSTWLTEIAWPIFRSR
jgi:DNA-binding transcriptional MerR regulator